MDRELDHHAMEILKRVKYNQQVPINTRLRKQKIPRPRTTKVTRATPDRYIRRHLGKRKTVKFGPNTVITITPRKINRGAQNRKNHNSSDDQQELTIGRNKPTREEQHEENNNSTKAKNNNRKKTNKKKQEPNHSNMQCQWNIWENQ